MDGRTCDYCGDPLPSDARSDQRFCSRSHKSAARKQRRRREKIRASLVTSGIPLDSRANDAASREADHRFHAMVAADEARRQPQAQLREYAEFERRNPGVAHPGRTLDRTQRGLQARANDWEQGTARFQRPVSTLAEQARASRARQRRPVIEPPGEWGTDGELEAATMIDGNVFRSGYRHASAYR
jgi:predicted nucleic acid-binding Zn ribbon protein